MNSKACEFFTTHEASQKLGVSVGTVQSLVDKGFLNAIFTQGGHRRILVESLKQYREKMGYRSVDQPKCIYVIHAGDLADLKGMATHKKMAIKIMTHPLELLDFQDHMDGLFIDARSPWLGPDAMACLNRYAIKCQVFIYNADALKTDPTHSWAPKVIMLQCNINGPIMDAYIHGKMH